MAIDEYLDIELSNNSEIYNDLMSNITNDGDISTIQLTGSARDMPCNLTPEMTNWFVKWVLGKRRMALQEIKSKFELINTNQGVPGFLLEAELAEIERAKDAAIQNELQQFIADPNIKKLNDDKKAKQQEYYTMRNKLDRDAVVWKPIKYWLGIMGVIIIEALINFESFTKIEGITPFFALGMTLSTSVFIGYAAHRHGIFIRQFKEIMGGDIGRKEKQTTITLDLIALLLLLLALGIVAWGRYNLVKEMIELNEVMGGEGNPWLQFIGAMLGNIGVYFFGVLWSSYHHDPMPGYMELRIEKESLEKEYNKRYSEIITTRVQQHIQKAEKASNVKRSADNNQRNASEYPQLRALFNKFQNKDAQIIGALHHYRSQLVRHILTNKKQSTFLAVVVTSNPADIFSKTNNFTNILKPEEYLGIDINMEYLT